MRLTLFQMMKLVVFGAAASLCLAPMVRLADLGALTWPVLVLFEAIAVPLVLALVAFPLVRAGPGKDRLIRALLLISVSVVLGFVAYLFAFYLRSLVVNLGPRRGLPLNLNILGMLAELLLLVVVLGAACFVLLRRVMRVGKPPVASEGNFDGNRPDSV